LFGSYVKGLVGLVVVRLVLLCPGRLSLGQGGRRKEKAICAGGGERFGLRQFQSQSADVNPGQVTNNSLTYSYDYNGGGYFHINYAFTIALLDDLSIEVTIVANM
jgi:hypothetical protein